MDSSPVGREILRDALESFFLERPVEAFEVGIVIGLPHSAMTMRETCVLREVGRKFRTVI